MTPIRRREPKITLVRVDALRGLAHIGPRAVEPEAGELLQRGCRQAGRSAARLSGGSRAAIV
jgi:hypothetical protein